MIVTLTNSSGAAINVPAVAEDGLSTGGGHLGVTYATHRINPLPFPFNEWSANLAANGSLANTGTVVQGIRPESWRRQLGVEAQSPASKLNMMIQAGTITMAYGAETGIQHPEEVWIGDVT